MLFSSRAGKARSLRLMRDRCVVLTYTAPAKNAYNYGGKPTYTEAAHDLPCTYIPQGGGEAIQTLLQVSLESATLYLPIEYDDVTTVLSSRDRIKITKRNGQTLATPLIYQLMGDPEPQPTLLQLHLRIVVEKPSS